MPEPIAPPRVMVVTDRRRLARGIASDIEAWPVLLTAQIAGALAGGADLIQVREPDLPAAVLLTFLRGLFRAVAGSAARVVVNDRADVAWVSGAAGVHLPERSLPVAAVRALRPGRSWIVGRSVHDPDGVAASPGATYLLAGTVLPSESKGAGAPTLGWGGLAQLVQTADKVAVMAIGGLRPEHAEAIRRSGAAGAAAIGWFLPERRTGIEASVERRVREMREAMAFKG